jgi:hypothetical protein
MKPEWERGSNVPGESKLAKEFLDEIRKSTVKTLDRSDSGKWRSRTPAVAPTPEPAAFIRT